MDRGNWWTIYNDPQLNASKPAERVESDHRAIRRRLPAVPCARAGKRARRISRPRGYRRRDARARSRPAALDRSVKPRGSISNSFNRSTRCIVGTGPVGHRHRTVGAQRAGEQGAAADLANARLSAQGTLAQTYFPLRSLDATKSSSTTPSPPISARCNSRRTSTRKARPPART